MYGIFHGLSPLSKTFLIFVMAEMVTIKEKYRAEMLSLERLQLLALCQHKSFLSDIKKCGRKMTGSDQESGLRPISARE